MRATALWSCVEINCDPEPRPELSRSAEAGEVEVTLRLFDYSGQASNEP